MYGITLAFKKFAIRKGILGSPWIGFTNFERLFGSAMFLRTVRNTILISLYRIVFGFPMPIIFALMLNEINNAKFKKTVQTISYLPHFISWVILGGIITELLSPTRGAVNYLLELLGFEPIYFMANAKYYRSILVISGIWKEMGWSSIIYLAAIAGIPTEQYEAAAIDGANRLKCMSNQGSFMFGYNTSDEKCKKIMEIKEAIASDTELYEYLYFGTEGVHYEKIDGYYLKLITDNDELAAQGVGYWWGMQPKSFEEYNKEVMTEYVESHAVAQANPFVYNGSNFYVSGENESKSWYGADVSTVASTFYNDALMGNIDIDEAWEDYIADLNAAGLDKIIAEYEEMLASK